MCFGYKWRGEETRYCHVWLAQTTPFSRQFNHLYQKVAIFALITNRPGIHNPSLDVHTNEKSLSTLGAPGGGGGRDGRHEMYNVRKNTKFSVNWPKIVTVVVKPCRCCIVTCS